MEFNKGDLYSRNDVWKKYHPNKGDKPKGGNWDTGYTTEGEELLAFLNIGSPGRTGHDFANQYDPNTETITWFGKTDSHSEQPIFKKLISGDLIPHFFARWDSSNTKFIYLGTGQILSFADDHPIENNKKAIKLNIQITENSSTIGPNGITNNSSLVTPKFGKKVTVLVNKYERDPLKRLQCIEFYGCNCQICGFNFLEKYGPLGENFCHVHHIEPLGEVGGEHDIDPTKDLIPVCPNCHAMLHRTKPSMKPDELEKIIGLKK